MAASPATAPAAGMCKTVTGTYAIYVNNDYLHVDRSRHLILVVSNALDDELDKRGWEDWVARGRFTLCGPRRASPLQWSVRDQVSLTSFTGVKFVRRPGN